MQYTLSPPVSQHKHTAPLTCSISTARITRHRMKTLRTRSTSNELYKEDEFKRFGISNPATWP
ncbi:hypothetical protein BD310DRAFT_933155 [Dichomitus squalens]|uniref:Uncharacterized protein n=1 Tax=Dichomitus squalens TaxID=114155 RepID=A0A4V2K7D5_9APHY|nr:hypothetical protein BD310DRAFT_933155 [Dichomitus squalens]